MGTKVIDIRNASELGGGANRRNPDFDNYYAELDRLQKLASASPGRLGESNATLASKSGAQQQLEALQAQGPPPEWLQTELGREVSKVETTGDAAAAAIGGAANAIRAGGDADKAAGDAAAGALGASATAAGNRAAPTIDVPGGGRTAQQDAIAQTQQFVPNTAGAAGIRTATTAGVNDIRTTGNVARGDITVATAGGTGGIRQATDAATGALNQYQTSQQGVQALQKFAAGPSGPSAAESMLRLQAARDKAAALSRARSARGGPGAVAEAMKVAQAEGAATSADTRGQLATVRAQEAAQVRGEQLTALSNAGQLIGQSDATRLGALTAAGNLGVQGSTAAGNLGVQGSTAAGSAALQGATAAGSLGVQGTTAASQVDLSGSDQALRALGMTADQVNQLRSMDIDVAKSQLSADLQTMGLNDEQTRFFAGLSEQARIKGEEARAAAQVQGMNGDTVAAQVALQAAEQAWQMLSADQQNALTLVGIQAGAVQANNANKAAERQQVLGFLGSGLMAGATLGSDRRIKRDIRKLRSMADALRNTPGSSYRYKRERNGKGQFTGPMAQDLEKTKEFRGAVREVDGIKRVDPGRLVLSHHAALSDLQRQIDRLERLGRKKPKREPEASEEAEA